MGAPSAAPSNCDPADLITNAGNKTVTLDAVTAFRKTNLSVVAINNLVLSAPSGSVNTVVLSSSFTNTLRIASNFSILSGGSLTVGGGSITVNNGLAVDGGAILTNGTVNVYSNMVVGDCVAGITGVVTIAGGSLYITNNTQTGVLDIRDGTFTLSSGVLQADTLVITNPCAQFLHTGGTLIVGNVVLSPNLFQILSIVPQTNGMLVTWMMGPGAINALQVTSGDGNGNYIHDQFCRHFRGDKQSESRNDHQLPRSRRGDKRAERVLPRAAGNVGSLNAG